MQLLRSIVFVPGNRSNMLERALGFGADIIMVDLEDSVPPGEKAAACELATEWVPRLAAAGKRVMVRINALDTGLASGELSAVVCPDLAGISIGKGNTAWDLQQVDQLLAPLEIKAGMETGSIKVVPWIETAMAIVHVYEMARASQRIVGIAFGGEDYTNDMGITRSDFGEECYFARSSVAVAARAAGVAGLDGPFVGFRDPGWLEDGLQRGPPHGVYGQVRDPSRADRHHQRDVFARPRRRGLRSPGGGSMGRSRGGRKGLAFDRRADGGRAGGETRAKLAGSGCCH